MFQTLNGMYGAISAIDVDMLRQSHMAFEVSMAENSYL